MERVEELAKIAQKQRGFGNSNDIDDLIQSLLAVASTDPLMKNETKLSLKFHSQVDLICTQARPVLWNKNSSKELQDIDRSCSKLVESLSAFSEHLEDEIRIKNKSLQ